MAQILIIDDDDLLRGVLAKALGHAGHNVIQATDGQQGVEVFRATTVDLVITDLIMPVQEGVETIIILRRERPALPIIAMSGGLPNSKVYLDIASKIGAKRILDKPFSPSELLLMVEDVLAEAQANQ
jgi:two-component system, chemotaxis family, chemotaxis protein CheY